MVCGSTREWICYILDTVHILLQTALLCRHFKYLNMDILLKESQHTDICVSRCQTDHTGQYAGYSGQTQLLIMWIGLWSSQIGFIIILLCELQSISQLTVIIILIIK